MAELGEAFNNSLKFQKQTFQNVDYFFTQRNMTEDHDYLDKNLNRKTKKIKAIHNFLALNIPTIITTKNNTEKPMGFDIEIFGDEGYHYKGTRTSYQGIVPNFMIPIKGDKKLFVHVNYKFADSDENSLSKKFVNFIDVPKRFQMQNDNDNETDSQVSKTDNQEINL